MGASRILALSFVFASLGAACAAPPKDDVATSGASAALSADSVGVVCRTLGEIGQCGSTPLCRTSTEGTCTAKASSIQLDPRWEKTCGALAGNQQACAWNSMDCTWEENTLCVPSSSGIPSAAAPDLPATCSALGELNACAGVPACKSTPEGVCRATDDAIAQDPQWEQMCPSAGTSQEACAVQSNCIWSMETACTPRAAAAGPLDVGTACMTLGQSGACGVAPTICKSLTEGQCIAKASALASDPSWARVCLGNSSEQACGWQTFDCQWQYVNTCVPLDGPRAGSVVDLAKACDTLGQIGSCSRAPICKPVAAGHCRATANALAGDPDWANQCAKAGSSQDTCGWLAPNCVWEPATRCVPR
jgi:hypothetical protein